MLFTRSGLGCRLALVFIISAIAASALGELAVAIEAIYSYDFDRCFVVTLTDQALQRSPAWRPTDANPPISARTAMSLAEREKRKLVKDANGWTWHLESAALVPRDSDRWYWRVRYTADNVHGIGGLPPYLSLAVLMDGTVIEPDVSARRSSDLYYDSLDSKPFSRTPNQRQNE